MIALFIVNYPCLDIILKLNIDDLPEFLLEVLVEHRGTDFDTIIDIPGHPVGRRDIIQFISSIGKDKNPRMFQVFVDDTDRLDIFALPGHTGDKGADAPDDQFDLNAGIIRLVKLGDHISVNQVVDLQNDISLLSFMRIPDFVVDEQVELTSLKIRGDDKVLVLIVFVGIFEKVKNTPYFGSDPFIFRQKEKIGIDLWQFLRGNSRYQRRHNQRAFRFPSFVSGLVCCAL